MSVSVCEALAAGEAESVTVTVICAPVTALLGVPLNVLPLSASPAGSVLPAPSDQWYGLSPPLATSVAEYGTPTVAAGRLVVLIDTAASGVTLTCVDNALFPTPLSAYTA